ncbi:MAG: hypothetical protein KBC57_08035 [Neisseriaceae bacterium]|nr:hypothetical protein [Neisseriaceae bacterium]
MKRLMMVMGLLGLGGCALLSQTYVETVHKLGLTPAYDQARMDQVMAAKSGHPVIIRPVVKAPEGTPDGPYVAYFEAGSKRYQTVVKQGRFDAYLDIYYENGQLRTHTPLQAGLAHGLSKGYLPNGQLQSTIEYQQGKAHGWASSIDASGQVTQRIRYQNGYPQ